MMCGGFTPDAKPATAEHQGLADGVKAAVEAKTNQTFSMFKVISFKRYAFRFVRNVGRGAGFCFMGSQSEVV